ncbi:phosphatase PAP2 family protein [Streptomyces beihaiensis]|uniref:Phosphatase PAP2 family protein n=1 Tax=Streptomyces beihaiensis TaxID=2984495 RepID=A0ABT3TMJ3_9ACTN|nr:phosphatase PAP2 family protein [Streptomyces beihaiensis]MCX3058269.1 phosphatase PAP2 family protein [Streptomyces beihaiensis]
MPPRPTVLNRRKFLSGSMAASVGVLTAPTAAALFVGPQKAAADTVTGTGGAGLPAAFVDAYTTNSTADLTAAGNAAVRLLGGFSTLWKTGDAWDTGTALDRQVLRANMRHSARVTRRRTPAEAKACFIHDRQDQSYGAIAGLGPLAPYYRTGAKAVTSIVSAPDGTPDTRIDDAVPADAPAGSATGPGSTESDLGLVVRLERTLRGPHASGNPSKLAYQYPRPYRMDEDSEVVDTGETDPYGFPVYRSDVVVAPQLLRRRSTDPATDGGFPSGHTNAFHLAALAYAYAVPERFQELVAHAFALSDSRIVAGMHSAVDVVGGRILATALAAATLHDPANASLKAAARAQALAYFEKVTGADANALYAFAHFAGADCDPYADRSVNAALVARRQTYMLPRRGRADLPLTVPKGAEVLLETRLPYLSAEQRRAVLRSTALPSGYPLLDGLGAGAEQWGRLDLFTAADGYGAFEQDVTVTLDAAAGGFHSADAWRNDIGGPGALHKHGTGTLTLTGENCYRGGTTVAAGVLAAGSESALGSGETVLRAGTLRIASGLRLRGHLRQYRPATLHVALGRSGHAPLRVAGRTVLDGGALVLAVPAGTRPGEHPVLDTRALRGQFTHVEVATPGWTATPRYSAGGVTVRLRQEF